MNNSSAQLKSLQVQIEQTRKDVELLRQQKEKLKEEEKFLNQKLSAFESSIAAAKKEIEKLSVKEIKRGFLLVSEHALLRYLERVYRIDIEAIKTEILTDEILTHYTNFGDGKFPHQFGKVIVRNDIVVTFED